MLPIECRSIKIYHNSKSIHTQPIIIITKFLCWMAIDESFIRIDWMTFCLTKFDIHWVFIQLVCVSVAGSSDTHQKSFDVEKHIHSPEHNLWWKIIEDKHMKIVLIWRKKIQCCYFYFLFWYSLYLLIHFIETYIGNDIAENSK